MSKNFCYFPILKTTDAELKAFNFLDASVKDRVLPIFELTKSRISKKNPDGLIAKKLDKLHEIMKTNPFILDLTTEPTFSNREIEELIHNGANGYEKWTKFLIKRKEQFNIIPMVHYQPQKKEEVKKQINKLKDNFPSVAFRIEIFQKESFNYIEDFFSLCETDYEKIIIILDGKYIHSKDDEKKKGFKTKVIDIAEKINVNSNIVCAFSSFPKSPRKEANCSENYGEFNLIEAKTNQEVINALKQKTEKIYHGDFASIHPVRYDTGGGGWIPRIDVPLDDKFFYYRYRRDEGSYSLCAKNVIKDPRYKKIEGLNSWGDLEVKDASEDNPNGKNPSHWIAVRANLYMTRQCLRLRRLNRFLSLSL